MCGLSSRMPAFAAKLDVYMLTLCSAMEDLARNEKESVQVLIVVLRGSITSKRFYSTTYIQRQHLFRVFVHVYSTSAHVFDKESTVEPCHFLQVLVRLRGLW